MSNIKPIQDVFYPSGGMRRGCTRSNEIDSVRDMNRSLLGQLDEARSELAQLRAERDAAILRGDTYRRRALALRRQAKAWRATSEYNNEQASYFQDVSIHLRELLNGEVKP